MSEIKIHREHDLGLEAAREIAMRWAEEVEHKFGMECTVIEGELSDTVEFSRSGVKGQLIVAPDHFDLHAKLGFLLGAFSRTIENEIEGELDSLLGAGAAKPARKNAATTAAAANNGGRAKAARPSGKAAAKTAGNGRRKA